MSIIRVKHNRENPFVMINKKALWDKDLSLGAVGLWSRLLSKPDDWEISAIHLSKACGCSIRQIYGFLKELIKSGYASRSQKITKGKKGFDKVSYEVFEFKNILTHDRFMQRVGTSDVKRTATNKEKEPKTDLKENPPLPSSKSKLPYNPTKEEEEEIFMRIKNRDKSVGRIINMKAYKMEILQNLRLEAQIQAETEKVDKDMVDRLQADKEAQEEFLEKQLANEEGERNERVSSNLKFLNTWPPHPSWEVNKDGHVEFKYPNGYGALLFLHESSFISCLKNVKESWELT